MDAGVECCLEPPFVDHSEIMGYVSKVLGCVGITEAWAEAFINGLVE